MGFPDSSKRERHFSVCWTHTPASLFQTFQGSDVRTECGVWKTDNSFLSPGMVVHVIPAPGGRLLAQWQQLGCQAGLHGEKPTFWLWSFSFLFFYRPRPRCLCLRDPELMPEGHRFQGWLVLIITSNWAPGNFQRHSCETSKSLRAPARGGKQHEAILWTWSWPAETTENWGKGWEVMKYAKKGLPIAKLTVKLEACRTTMEENQSTFSTR